MIVPDLEELVNQAEQAALPETRLRHLIEGHANRSLGDERLLMMCREALCCEDDPAYLAKYRAYRARGGPTDEGYKLYHRIFSVLAGLYPGLGTWQKETVLNALEKVVESGL